MVVVVLNVASTLIPRKAKEMNKVVRVDSVYGLMLKVGVHLVAVYLY